MIDNRLIIFFSIPLLFIGVFVGEFIGVFIGKNILIHLPPFFRSIFFNYPFWVLITAFILDPIENTLLWSKIYDDRKTLGGKFKVSPVSIGIFVGIVMGIIKLQTVVFNSLLNTFSG